MSTGKHRPNTTSTPVSPRRVGLVGALAVFVGGLVMLFGSPASAADFNVNSHSVGQFFEYVRVDGDVVPRRRVTQYLGLNGYDLTGDGSNKISFQTSMRFDTDLGLIDKEFEDADYALERRFNAFHLMYAYVEGRELWNRWSFKAGRQLHIDVLGWYDFDGLWTSVRIWQDLFVEVYGGLEVKADTFILNDAGFDPDGTSQASTGFQLEDRNVFAIAGTLKWENDKDTQARVTYRRTFYDISSGVETERLGAYAHQRLWERLKIFGGLVFNFYITDLDQAELGAEFTFPEVDVTTALEYFRQIPFFDADSIFNVFDVRGYDDLRARVGWQIMKDLYISVRGGVRLYHSDGGTELGSDEMFNGRLTVRWLPGAGIWTHLIHQSEAGLGGRKHYTSVGMRTPFYYDFWQITGSLMHVNFDSDYATRLEGNGFGAVVGNRFRLGEWGDLEVRGEQAINPFAKSETRVYAFFDLDFWF